jgi:phenylacetate-CoA ligase
MFKTMRFALRLWELKRVLRKNTQAVSQLQTRRLRRLVRFAIDNSAHYRAKFRGIDPEHFTLSQLPPSNKGELMANFDRAVTDPEVRRTDVERFVDNPSNVGQFLLGKYGVSHTSGSQGQPLLIVQTRTALELMFSLQMARGNAFTGIGLGEIIKHWWQPARLAVISMKPGFYPSASAFAYFPKVLRPFVQIVKLSWTDPDLVARLNELRPEALTAYAFVLESLALQSERLHLAPELRQIVNYSEQVTERARARIEETFHVPILDTYATGECLFLTNGCPTNPGAHVNADWAILEVVDQDYRPVPPGRPGKRVLITNLANTVQPIIRYEIDDMVTMADQPCACGSLLPRVARIDGRAAEGVWVGKKGAYQLVLGGVFKKAFDHLRQVREWQSVQVERNRFQVNVELLPGAKLDKDLARKLLNERLHSFDLPSDVAIDVRFTKSLRPDPKTGKVRRILSRVGPPADLPQENKREASAA